MSLYQGSDSMVPLFDHVLVINSGRLIFYGKATEAKSYFEGLGFECPERTTLTDFLNSMTAEPELRHIRSHWQGPICSTPAHFEEAFKTSQHYQDLMPAVLKQQAPSTGKKRQVYALPLHRQILECAVRQFKVLVSDTNTWMTEAITIVVQSLVLGTVFRDQPRSTSALFIFASSLFTSVLVPALQSMAEFNNSFAERPLVIRQKRYRFYRPGAYAFGLVITDAVWSHLLQHSTVLPHRLPAISRQVFHLVLHRLCSSHGTFHGLPRHRGGITNHGTCGLTRGHHVQRLRSLYWSLCAWAADAGLAFLDQVPQCDYSSCRRMIGLAS